jgi:hypothetical protein
VLVAGSGLPLGTLLLASSPAGPVQDPRRVARWRPDECGDQPADLGHGDREQVGAADQAATPPLGCWFGVGAGDDQEGVGEQRQDGMPLPAGPAANLVVVQADLALSGLEALLYSAPGPATRTSVASGVPAGPAQA